MTIWNTRGRYMHRLLIIAIKLTDKSAETFVLILKDVLFYVDKLYYTISIIYAIITQFSYYKLYHAIITYCVMQLLLSTLWNYYLLCNAIVIKCTM